MRGLKVFGMVGVLLFMAAHIGEGEQEVVNSFPSEDEIRKLRPPEVEEFFKAQAKKQKIKGRPFRYYDPRWAARVADCIVIGTVEEVRENPEGPYHTWVTISVERYLKGGEHKKEVLVKLISGRFLVLERTNDQIRRTDKIYKMKVSTEPSFRRGEKVLVFLSRIPWNLHPSATSISLLRNRYIELPPDNPYRYVTECKGYYEPLGRHKYTISGNEIMITPFKRRKLEEFIEEIISAMEGGKDEDK